ncbi:hypothetical protein ACPWT1_00940 [Ramlibacter sp. MMS24-I3-19]|uniref:hypothetical protein n=1 Tax=Ramlibacter sp. MMS24-I3-19 TaxID=3416606 RepID=UPI003CFBD0F2
MDIASTGRGLDRLFQLRVLDHCEHLARRSELLFVLAFTAISLLLSLAMDFGLTHLGFVDREGPALLAHGAVFLFSGGVILAPLTETFMLQQLPIWLSHRWGMSRVTQFLMGSIPFAAMHFETGVVNGFAGGVAGGSS